jgi:hypothetical protein
VVTRSKTSYIVHDKDENTASPRLQNLKDQ